MISNEIVNLIHFSTSRMEFVCYISLNFLLKETAIDLYILSVECKNALTQLDQTSTALLANSEMEVFFFDRKM